jgi:hypothetical protein
VSTLDRLRDELREDAGLLGVDLDGHGAAPAAAATPDNGLDLAIEAVREGYLLHYGAPRLALAPDPDLALLAGDRLYALGLERLAQAGELDAIAELSDVISLCAQAHSLGDADLAGAVWEAGEHAVRHGSTPVHRAAKVAAAAGETGAAGALRASARQAPRGGRLDVDDSLPPRLTQ